MCYTVGICDTVHFVYHVSLQKYGSIRYCITISTVRIMYHYSLKNRAVVEHVTDKLISKLLYYKYRFLISPQDIRILHKTHHMVLHGNMIGIVLGLACYTQSSLSFYWPF